MTNVKLSKEEFDLVTNAEFILTKNRIIQKVYDLFGELSNEFRQMSVGLNEDIIAVSPKIAKGENYLGLPWVMLDYPRNFSKADVLSVRCFFWWGNFFSITLQLHGKFQEQYSNKIISRFNDDEGWWICNDATDAWQHHFNEGYYVPISPEADLTKKPFIKLAKKIPLQQWDNAFLFYTKTYGKIMSLLST